MLFLPDWLESDASNLISDVYERREQNLDIINVPLEVEEQLLVDDLLYCLIGASGNYIQQNSQGKYSISVQIHNCFRSFVNNILPICENFSIVRKYAEGHYRLEHGSVIHATCTSMRNIITEYYQLITKIQNYRRLTIGLLLSNLQIPAEIFQLLASVVKELESKRGISVLIILHKYYSTFRGSEQIRKMILYLFQSAMKPFIKFIEKWVYEGIIEDPFDEFFIKQNENITPEILGKSYEEEFWLHRYDIKSERLPPSTFMSHSVVYKILNSGKYKSILRLCGIDSVCTKKLTAQSLQRESIFDQIQEKSSSELIRVLLHRYDLQGFFKCFHDYLLCARGDWINHFLELNRKTMKQTVDKIHVYSLDTTLSLCLPKEALSIFSCVLDSSLVIDEIQKIHNTNSQTKYKIQNRSQNSWDNFSFDIHLEWPVSLVFYQTIQRKYLILFRIILMWKRLERSISKLWHRKRQICIRRFESQLHFMQIFICSYLNFASTFTIEPEWANFQRRLTSVKSIEELFKLHEDHLDHLLKVFFVVHPNVFRKMTYIWYVCFEYASELKKWLRSVSNHLTSKESKLQLGEPLNKLYNAFEKSVQGLIEDLRGIASREANSNFSDLANFININDAYFEKEY
ncbi:gamma-tubulin complex component 2-like isoform X1 [Histomonas meleagridis]|uniref:gamma-tubulin complex component 2-like isoform X1 n=1 Tax=Histomonas meleagridis TaxID=135588 RepID=UPI003559FE56|nr:gamma-tubulin complex component 2-like isoform X1 [Histomonas meleagridis]KAH0804157.1 gamma-tubulin complex component 2-like isoform X1 [Histomonas meleagridis]